MRVPLAAPAAYGRQLRTIIERFETSQWWSPEVLERYQLDQLGQFLAHAHETVPFCRERLAAAGYRPGQAISWDFWRSLPRMGRGDVQDLGDALRCASLPPEHGGAMKISTTGSTGRPVTVWRSGQQMLVMAAVVLRKLLWQGWDFRLKLGVIARDTRDASFAPAGARFSTWGSPAGDLYETGSAVLLDNRSSTAEIADWLLREAPDYLRVTPGVLRDLCFHFMDERIPVPALKGIQCSSEITGHDLRDLVRHVFGLPVFASYGAKEFGTIAVQCPEHEHYHVQAEALLVEVLDDAGNPCLPGETGTVVITALQGFAFPLIRYEVGDRAVAAGPCPCGRPHPVLAQVVGRVRDPIVLPSGERRYVYTGRGFSFWQYTDLRQFQIIQRTLHDLEVKLVARRPLTPDVEAEIARRIKAATSEHFAIRFTYHDAIPPGPGGKLRDFVCEVDQPSGPLPR